MDPIQNLSNELAEHRRDDRNDFDQTRLTASRIEGKVDACAADVKLLLAAFNMTKGANFLVKLALALVVAIAAVIEAYRALTGNIGG